MYIETIRTGATKERVHLSHSAREYPQCRRQRYEQPMPDSTLIQHDSSNIGEITTIHHEMKTLIATLLPMTVNC